MLDWRMHHCGCIPLSMIFSITPPSKNRRLRGSRIASAVRSAVQSTALIALLIGTTGLTTTAIGLEAGFAKADITPILGTPLAGRLERQTGGRVALT